MTEKKEEIYNYLINRLTQNRNLPFKNKNKILKYRYLDMGHIDSMELIRFIFDLEDFFKIKLTENDTSSDEFRYVDGLIKIIASKTK